MKFIPITGRLTFVGNSTAPATKDASRPNANWTYSSLIFRETGTGEEITVPNCKVSGNLNRHIDPGEEGTFLVAKVGNERTLIGFKNDRQETVNDWVLNPRGQILIPLAILIVGILTIPLFFGVLIIPYAIWMFFRLQSMPKKLKDGLVEHGFEVRGPRVV